MLFSEYSWSQKAVTCDPCGLPLYLNINSRSLNNPLTVAAEFNSHVTLITQWFTQDAAMVHIKLYNPWCCATLWYIKIPIQQS